MTTSREQAELSLQPFVNLSGHQTGRIIPAKPFLVTKEEIDAEIVRLSNIAQPLNHRRVSAMVPKGEPWAIYNAITPGTRVSLSVVLPGEKTAPARENSNQIEITISGSGIVETSKSSFSVDQNDVCTLPPMEVYSHLNEGRAPWVRLTYSNQPMLEYLGCYFFEEGEEIRSEESRAAEVAVSEEDQRSFTRETAPDIALGNEGARLRGYEFLTDIEFMDAQPLVWRWLQIVGRLPVKQNDGKRPLWLLYNPETGRRNGTSASYFATWAGCAPDSPPMVEHRGHRHISASINYHVQGSGRSVVDGSEVSWKAGDLLFSAPSWSEHTHYPGPDGWQVLTVQDHPMHISLGSLLWQERMEGKIYSLGQEAGQTGFTAPRNFGR